MKSRDMVRCSLFAGLIGLCAQMGVGEPVAFTMQTFGIFLTLLLLGGKLGSISVAIYLMLGAVGLPVFSGFRGGLGMLLGPTGGYLAGFLAIGPVFRLVCTLHKGKLAPLWGLCLGLLSLYAFGTVWFAAIFGSGLDIWGILLTCVVPYILPDLGKLLLSWCLFQRLKKHIEN